MPTPAQNQKRFDAAFEQFAAIMRKETHNDASLFRMISGMAEYNPLFAGTFSGHLADTLDECTGEVEYTTAAIEAWKRTLLPAPRTTHDYFEGKVKDFEEFIAAVISVDKSGASFFSATASLLH